MAEQVAFELVSPERLLVSEDVDMVVVPGEEGDFGVLAGHSRVLSLMRPGVVGIYDGDNLSRQIFVAGGFAEANERGCIVLAEQAVPVEEIDVPATQQELRNTEEDLGEAKDDDERARIERRITALQAQLEAAGATS